MPIKWKYQPVEVWDLVSVGLELDSVIISNRPMRQKLRQVFDTF